MSCILGKKPNPKQNWKHSTHKKPMFLQVASLPVSLLEFLCAVVSNCHRFCSLHERGRSRQLRLRKPCPAISFPKVPQVLCKKDHLLQGENPLFKILRIWRVLICTLQLLSPACWLPKETFPAVVILYLDKTSHICSRGQRHGLYRLVKLLHRSINSLHWAGTKRNLQHYTWMVTGKWCMLRVQRGSTTAQSSQSCQHCSGCMHPAHTGKAQIQLWGPSAQTHWAGVAAKPLFQILPQSITSSILTALVKNKSQYLIFTLPKQFLLAQVIYTQELSNSN